MKGALVVNADDLGVSKGATLGILRAHREGIVSSASLAVTTPYYEHALNECVLPCPDLGIGLHFTLTSGKPLSSASDVPLLVDEKGFFRWRFLSLLLATSVSNNQKLLEQIEIELEAQIKRLITDSIQLDHIDGERHIHLIPAIFERVVAAAKRHSIPFIRLGKDIGTVHVKLGDCCSLVFGGGLAKSGLLSYLSALNRQRLGSGLAYAEHFASYLYTGRINKLLSLLLQSNPPDGVLEIMVHPGLPEKSLSLALGNEELERYLASNDRVLELESCIEARAFIKGWRLTTFRELAKQKENQK